MDWLRTWIRRWLGTPGSGAETLSWRWSFYGHLIVIALNVVWIVAVVTLVAHEYHTAQGKAGTAVLWALGFSAAGTLLGFIFGVPKVVQSEAKDGHVRQLVNGNLEQISDW